MGKVVGILGDGQLARMMVEAGMPLGLDIVVLGNSEDKSVLGELDRKNYYNGDICNYNDVYEFCSKIDSLTVDIEHFNLKAVEDAQAKWNFKVVPPVNVLKIMQDKLVQKEWLSKCKLPTSKMYDPADIYERRNSTSEFPLVVKSRRQGFDGRGIHFLDNVDELSKWQDKFSRQESQFVFEKKLNVLHELAIAVIRDEKTKEIQTYPCVETIQKDGMCRAVVAPAPLSKDVLTKADDLARQIASLLDLNGLICIEMFYCDSGLFVNEIAPRPHNSAHYTIEACLTSQFEQVMRFTANLQPGSVKMVCRKAMMFNLIGVEGDHSIENFEINARDFVTRIPSASLHLYKKQPKLNRKIGHFTLLGDDINEMLDSVHTWIDEIITFESLTSSINKIKLLFPHRRYDVAICMGSKSDLPTMRPAVELLKNMGVPTLVTIVSAHRTPDRMYNFAQDVMNRDFKVLIAGAGGSAHLPGMLASMVRIPVIGVPVSQKNLAGADSLYSIVQMPPGIPVATVAIDNSTNAAILAIQILSLNDEVLCNKLQEYKLSLKLKVINDAEALEHECNTTITS